MDRNAEIAKMLGYEYIDKDYSDISYLNYGWWVKGVYYETIDPIMNKDFKGIFIDFSSDWNKLMEVVEFIEKLKPRCMFFISSHTVSITKEGERIVDIDAVQKPKKEAVFIAVSDFAKCYNNET